MTLGAEETSDKNQKYEQRDTRLFDRFKKKTFNKVNQEDRWKCSRKREIDMRTQLIKAVYGTTTNVRTNH